MNASGEPSDGDYKSPTSPFLREPDPSSPLKKNIIPPPTTADTSHRQRISASFPKSSDVTPNYNSGSVSIPGSRALHSSSTSKRSTGPVQRISVSHTVSSSVSIDGASTSTAGSDPGTIVSRIAVDTYHNQSSLSSSTQKTSLVTENQERCANIDPPAVRTDPRSTVFGGKSSMESISSKISTGPGIVRQTSLRTKLSLPTLRRHRSREDDTVGLYDRNQLDANGRLESERTCLQGRDWWKDVVQVQDTEFELVRPNLVQLQSQQQTSDDSTPVRPEGSVESRTDSGGLLRPESPISLNSSAPRSPIFDNQVSTGISVTSTDSGTSSLTQSSESVEAHRQRELKWISLMSSAPASLSRKSKKVKKLLVEGVPSSVRYLIWSYLTDGKGRAVKGVYEQLCKRGVVQRTRDITADADRLFGIYRDGETVNDGTRYLHATRGAVVILLQAYFSMVPDVQYLIGDYHFPYA